MSIEKKIQEFLEENPPTGYVPSAADFEHFAETMAATADQYPDLAIVDGELVRGRKQNGRFVVAPEEVERMSEQKRERRRDNDQNPGVERLPKGLL